MSNDVSTWTRTKDTFLVGTVGVILLAAMKLLADVSELKTQLAVYQADAKTQKERGDKHERDLEALKSEVFSIRVKAAR